MSRREEKKARCHCQCVLSLSQNTGRSTVSDLGERCEGSWYGGGLRKRGGSRGGEGVKGFVSEVYYKFQPETISHARSHQYKVGVNHNDVRLIRMRIVPIPLNIIPFVHINCSAICYFSEER